MEYWAPLVNCRSIWAYRLYSHFCGHSKYILSQPVANELNRALNPEELLPVYTDKNIFDKMLPAGSLPKTVIRVMDGLLMDAGYNVIENFTDKDLSAMLSHYSKVVLKPTVDTDSGRGVRLFDLTNQRDINTLTVCYIRKSGNNMILQEAIRQSDFMSQFNPTSVNTLRVATYKSPYSGNVHILSAVIRMGAPGSDVDNLHQAGHMVRVDINTGELAKCCFNANGVSSKSHGSIDFSNHTFIVPGWEYVKEFAKTVTRSLPHLKLLQLDIAIDKDGGPRLLEYNAGGFAMWIAQFTGTPALGEHTEEIRKYALEQKHSVKIYPTRHRI